MNSSAKLNDHFLAVVYKRLSAVEISPNSSNQHEFNGTASLRSIFGDEDRRRMPATFIWLGGEQEAVSEDGFLTWYDARRRHASRTEYRMYYPSNAIMDLVSEGDTTFIALCRDGSCLVVFTPTDSILQHQLIWLFGLESQPELSFAAKLISPGTGATLDFAARYILDELGIQFIEPEADIIDSLIEPFGLKFPNTREFSQLARSSLPDVSPLDDNIDEVLLAWLEREQSLFRRLESRIVSERLSTGFMDGEDADVEGFLEYSLSVQNRRKARAGQSLENHLEEIFSVRGVRHSRGKITEKKYRPDFIFPSIDDYHDHGFPADCLTMLGAKSTLKDRWRQVLSEAAKIPSKHLLTLEPALSVNQTDQISGENIQLVIPKPVQLSYGDDQQSALMDLSSFIDLVLERQAGP